MNDENKDGNYTLIQATINNNTKIVKLLITYVEENNINTVINKEDKMGTIYLIK